MRMQIIVTGSRDWTDAEAVWSALDRCAPTLVVHGGARGADEIAEHWGVSRGVHTAVFPARWHAHDRKAGSLRNRAMVDAFPAAIVLAFPLPQSVGTRHCVQYARAQGLIVYVWGAN